MLFWSFVLAFILSILYYMTPIYNVVQVEGKPLADSLVSEFVTAHQAAKRLMYRDEPGKKCVETDEDGNTHDVDCIKDASGNIIDDQNLVVPDTSQHIITFAYKQSIKQLDERCMHAPSATNGYFQTDCNRVSISETPKDSLGQLVAIDSNKIRQMLPVSSGKDISSVVACISNKGTTEDQIEPYLTFDCNGGKSNGIGDYVVTYMRAPGSDEDVVDTELWRSGILRRTKGSHECGVLSLISDNRENRTRQKYDIDAEYVLDNSRRFTVSIPNMITTALKQQYQDDHNFLADMNDGYLLFCITPIDDIRASFQFKCKKGYGRYTIDGDTSCQDERKRIKEG
ncbi:MAG: hypothetical protein IKV03_02660 [Alphaproteobacteria bacterium]|nr:hypothetical protein [Alphaproteobacteria bacterium]